MAERVVDQWHPTHQTLSLRVIGGGRGIEILHCRTVADGTVTLLKPVSPGGGPCDGESETEGIVGIVHF
jgi:hypothetical protein